MDRLSPGDLTILATDGGPVPMQIAAVLTFERTSPLTREELVALLEERLPSVPRLTQRLVVPGRGRGDPHWGEDPNFVVAQHVSVCSTTSEHGLLGVAAEQVCRRLDESRPLWRACLVQSDTGADGLIIVMHHVLADGLGGLAVLAALADPSREAHSAGDHPVLAASGTPRPGRSAGAEDSPLLPYRLTAGIRAIGRGVAGIAELGGRHRPRLAAHTSLNRPTGPRRALARVSIPLADAKDAAHRTGATVNDVVIAAVVGALLDLLHRRGEHPDSLVVSVPVSARPSADARELGNRVGVRPLRVPAIADDQARLGAIVALRENATSAPRASSAAPLGLAFRGLAKAGLFLWFVNRQRLVHTFVTNLRGPPERLTLAGREITSITAVTVNPGNVAVSFAVLSYAGDLGVTVVTDLDVIPEGEQVSRDLRRRLDALTRG